MAASGLLFGGIFFLVSAIFGSLSKAVFGTDDQVVRGAFVFLFLIMQMIATSLTATGAFEVHVNGKLFYSKLKTKKFPFGEDLIAEMKAVASDKE
mmetsp:Transcript_16803/g.42176  ORF Transcript_16803/g.42176 Transcript_16803/m.42176 type:complete len:95 (-) Transcript_16803:384-668(-)